ncbi:MAG TPA: hypothetical protein VFY90_14090 [Tepidiformaceae bacterium]|nr:hypothetical protein [Tepidiformaceae bacterium]
MALARRLPTLAPEGPDAAASTRLRARLYETLNEGWRQRTTGWLASWAGAGAIPRPLTQRFAAGFLLLGALGSGAAGATGSSPADWASDAGNLGHNVIVSFDPRNGGNTDGAAVPTPTVTTTPLATPSPLASATPSTTPDAEDDGREDDGEDDSGHDGTDDSSDDSSGDGGGDGGEDEESYP